jgi:hypothetical protein
MKLLIACLLLFFFNTSSFAEKSAIFSAAEMLSNCENFTGQSKLESFEMVYCAAYFQGVLDGFGYAEYSQGFDLYCAPEDVKSPEKILIIKKYFQEHQNILHSPAPQLAAWALSEAFPCKN